MSTDPKATPTTPTEDALLKGIRIYSYPKIIFIWPTLVASLICGIGMLFLGDDLRDPKAGAAAGEAATVEIEPAPAADADAKAAEPGPEAGTDPQAARPLRRFTTTQNILGVLFMFIFAVNVMVMAMDFPRFTIVAAVLLIAMIAFLMLWLGASAQIDWLSWLSGLAENVYVVANAGFYFAIAVILGLMFLVIYFSRFLDFWEFRPNEILHNHGPMSDLERYPTTNLKFDKEIPDVLEYLLGLGAGRLVLHIGNERKSVVLDNVLFIDSKEEALKSMMSRLNVRILPEQVQEP